MTDLPLALLQSALHQAPYGMALVNPDGQMLSANQRFLRMLGIHNGAPLPSLHEIFPDAPEVHWPDEQAGRALEWETRLDVASGVAREAHVTVGPLLENTARLVTIADVGSQRQRERRLYALWEFSSVVSASLDLKVLLENVCTEVCDVLEAARVGFSLVDPDTRMVQASATYEAGAPAPEIRLVNDEPLEGLPAPVRQVMDQAETVFIHFHEEPGTGRELCTITLPMVARGLILGAFTAEDCPLERHLASEHISICHAIANQTAVAADNVRLLNAEIASRREISRLQDYYRVILDNGPDGVFVTDASGVVRFWNRRMEEMFDVLGDEIVGQSLFDRIEVWQAHSAAFQRVVESEEPVPIARAARCNHLGEDVVESIHFQPLWRGNTFDGVMARVSDVTDQARLEKQLIRSERMAAVGELASGVAHNFNNILAGIGGDAQLLRMIAEEDNLGDTVKNSADMIYRETMRGGRIAHDLLSFARGQEPCLSEVDASTIVNEAVRLARTHPQAANVDLRPQVPADLPRVSGDPNQLHQVFFNIILNAIQAMPHGGTLTVDARISQGSDGKARMEVMFQDTGVGIPAENLHRIFDPFFSNRRGGAVGTGLGLSVSHSMIRGMDGDIRVESEVGRGTTMTVLLPIVERRRRPRVGERPKIRILLADDEPNIRRTLATFLSRRGYHVLAARDGQEVLNTLEDGENGFKLVILDLLMPHMSGLETIHALRKTHPDLPVVLLTGVANADELAQVTELGIQKALRKPVDFDELLSTVEHLAGPADGDGDSNGAAASNGSAAPDESTLPAEPAAAEA